MDANLRPGCFDGVIRERFPHCFHWFAMRKLLVNHGFFAYHALCFALRKHRVIPGLFPYFALDRTAKVLSEYVAD